MKKILLPFIASLFWIPAADALDIGFDYTDWGGNNSGATTSDTIFNFTVGSNPYRLLVVAFAGERQEGTGVESVSYGAQSFTRATFAQQTDLERAEIWYLLGPTAGTGNVTVTLGTTGTRLNGWSFQAYSFYNVLQSAPTSTNTAVSATTSTSTSFTLEAVEGGVFVDAVAVNRTNGSSNPAATGNQTAQVFSNSAGSVRGAFGYELTPTGGNQTQGWSWSGSDQNAYAGAVFAPIPEPGSVALFAAGLAFAMVSFRRRRAPRNR
jgi:hypothetical protein